MVAEHISERGRERLILSLAFFLNVKTYTKKSKRDNKRYRIPENDNSTFQKNSLDSESTVYRCV